MDITIRTRINGRTYEGTVVVEDRLVDLSNLNLTEDELYETVYFNNQNCGSVKNLLRREALYATDVQGYVRCECSGYIFSIDDTVVLRSGETVYYRLTEEYKGDYYLRSDCVNVTVRDEDGTCDMYIPEDILESDYRYCEHCGSYVFNGNFDYAEGECIYCSNNIIEKYSQSHTHEPILFGEYKSVEEFAGLGFELEVDCDDSRNYENNSVAKHLCEHCGLDSDEMRYAHDGSLRNGFECISQPHTVKAFWEKQKSWERMLKYLSNNGYRSHDTTTCGLHVHVSRTMFGRTEEEQSSAIAKIYCFFDSNWDDIVRISRRKNFEYCEKNSLQYYENEDISRGITTRYKCWKRKANGQRGHYVALNNANSATFEYRLGRGTLNSWSFFSWIDFIVTITKNAKRLTVGKVNSNDLVSWLGGIKESTAKYIYKRGAFRSEMLALYPNIAWETDITDSVDHND